MTTNDDQYVPSDEDMRSVWVVHERDCGWEPHPGDPSAEFDRFLARVRRDAAREALNGLAAAEHRATRAEAQSAVRGRAVVIYRERAREAEARIKAVEDVLRRGPHEDARGNAVVHASAIRRAMDGG